jgi:murein DD-endopeptidase MepM/ murein hydrolase activator NlpD
MEPYAPVYSPVEGVVVCERNGVGPGSGGPQGPGCAGANDYSGPSSEWAVCGPPNYKASEKSGAGTIMIKVTKNGTETGEVLVLGHMAGSLVKVGDRVKPNQQVGTAGCMNGWHTHVEYYTPADLPSKLKLVDPVKYL